MLELYTTPLSANGRKVQAATLHLDLDVDVHEVNVYAGEGRRSEYLRINPSGKIPTLVDGDFVLTESNAILIYLVEANDRFELFSADPRERAVVTSWLFWESAHWQPALSAALASTVGHALRPEHVPAPESGPDWQGEPLRSLLLRLDTRLADHAFVAGDSMTIADFAVAGMTTYFRKAGFPFDTYPGLASWFERIEDLDAWRRTAVAPWA